MAIPFRLYNTLSRQTEDFVPREAGKVGLYVCGMTVYDHCHVGHARAMVVFDTFVRYLRHRGWDVNFVRNFTDVDDKIIARANERSEEPIDLAKRYIEHFHEDTDALGLLRPDSEPRVSESIASIQGMIQQLIDNGHAYAAEGSVWFDVQSFDEYGKLSGQKIDELRSADPQPGKKHAADFALWKAVKPGEPEWPSPWGAGRPGWHIECSAMATTDLGQHFDIHGGGLDLVFPHHENEIAQSECAHHSGTWVNYWMHNGLLVMDSGQKMGKSLGNVINIRDALANFPAEAVRLYYLQAHYRSPLPWNEQSLSDALGMLARLYDAREKAESMGGQEDAKQVAQQLGEDAQKILELSEAFDERFYGPLDTDFNSAQALGIVFELARAVNRFAEHKKARKRGGPVVAGALRAFAALAAALNVVTLDTETFQEEVKTKRLAAMGLDRAEVDAQVAKRTEHRENKEWAASDAIRDALEAQNIAVMDTAEGTVWRVRVRVSDE